MFYLKTLVSLSVITLSLLSTPPVYAVNKILNPDFGWSLDQTVNVEDLGVSVTATTVTATNLDCSGQFITTNAA